MSDRPDGEFFGLLQAFRLTVTKDRLALRIWHHACMRSIGEPLPPGVGLGVVFETARAHVCINRP